MSVGADRVRRTGFSRRCAAVLAAAVAFNLLALLGWARWSSLDAAGAGVGLVAYLLGVRHAFDADHIAAIDNVTRRLLAAGERPSGVGLFFSLGHSTVVLLLVTAVAIAARRSGEWLPRLAGMGASLGTVVSAGFLTLIGLANLRLLAAMLRGRNGDGHRHAAAAGFAGRMVDRSWKMYPLGLLFGLGFDTASEVALLALSLAAARGSAPLWGVLLLPLQFAAGMALMDTLESLLMLRAYQWAMRDGDRTLRLNTAITALSVAVALAVAASEWLGLAGLPVAAALPALDSAAAGLLVTAGLLGLWLLALWRHRRKPEAVAAQSH